MLDHWLDQEMLHLTTMRSSALRRDDAELTQNH